MIFNQTLIDLLDKANPTQMQELELLKDIQSPNTIQLQKRRPAGLMSNQTHFQSSK